MLLTVKLNRGQGERWNICLKWFNEEVLTSLPILSHFKRLEMQSQSCVWALGAPFVFRELLMFV